MSKQEQNALMAFINSFRPSKRVTAFEQLSNGKVLMEVMATVDATHFKDVSSRRQGPGAGSSSDNWVLKMNALKRLYRLLLSFPLPSPHHPLSASSLPEPSFSSVAKSPDVGEGLNGLIQLVRMCLAVSVWAPGNEKVIAKIQSLGEAHMAELMRSIEEIMATMPPERDETPSPQKRGSPTKRSPDLRPPSPPSGLRADRDRLSKDNEELTKKVEELKERIEELNAALEEAQVERDIALDRSTASDGPSSAAMALRTSQNASSEVDSLRADLARAEEELARTEADLEKQRGMVTELNKTVDDLRPKAAEAAKLRDQLDEYRHTAERLQKSENVIEKYKKKLEESAGLRRELKGLEEENANLINRNSDLEADLRKSGLSKSVNDNYESQAEELERRIATQDVELGDLTAQLEDLRLELAESHAAHEHDRDELHLHQEKARELEGGGPKRQGSVGSMTGNNLGVELGAVGEDDSAIRETKTDLKLRIKSLERDLQEAQAPGGGDSRVKAVENLLAEATKARDNYQRDYLQAHREHLRLQATIEKIQSGAGDSTQTASALRSRLEEVVKERDSLLQEKEANDVTKEEIQKQLRDAHTDLGLLDKDQREMLASLRESVSSDTNRLEDEIISLKDEVSTLREKDRMHLEEIKLLLMQKVDLQATGINQREKAIEREREMGDLKSSLSTQGLSSETQSQILDLATRNGDLTNQVAALRESLEKAKSMIKNQDSQLAKKRTAPAAGSDAFEEAQKAYESQISTLKEDLMRARSNAAAIERRYKLESELMLSAWHDLGSKLVRDHLGVAGGTKRSQPKSMPGGWLGRQRRYQDDASFVSPR